jgi:general secretion pathway protein I
MPTGLANTRLNNMYAPGKCVLDRGRKVDGFVDRFVDGFTLLEVLVALAIVATALGASLRAIGSLTQNSQALRTSTFAAWSAENRLVQIRLNGAAPALGGNSFSCPQSDLQLICAEQISATPNAHFRRVTVTVHEAGQPQRSLIDLSHVVPNGS